MSQKRDYIAEINLIVGPIVSVIFLIFVNLDPGRPEVTRTAAVALLMAIWWITEAIPLAITSLIPIVLFPILGIMGGKTVASFYINHVIFLFIGGFLVAIAMERCNLHKRIALGILLLFGIKPRSVILGFMLATAFLSMWISNTATTMMMVPIVLAIILSMEDIVERRGLKKYSIGLLLAVAYSASIGGMATPVGTPPNPVFLRILTLTFPNAPDISFTEWITFALPISVLLLIVVWLYILFFYCPRRGEVELEIGVFKERYKELGSISFEECVVLLDFIILVFLWLFRKSIHIGGIKIPGWAELLQRPDFIDDGTVAIAMAILLFLIPAKRSSANRIMEWDAVLKLPWNVVLLFGGGFALAGGFKSSGLSLWIGNQLEGLSTLHPILVIGLVCLTITFLTELTSNTASVQIILPVLGAMAVAVRLNPLLLMIPATLSCSCAFMLPVATPPNAIIFGTRRLRIMDMVKAGFLLNLIGVIIITTATYFLGIAIFDIDISQFPDWAKIG